MRVRLLVATLVVAASSLAAEAASWIIVPHMGGSLAISADRVGTVWYSSKGEAASSTMRVIYDGNAQGKVLSGSEASTAWQAMQADQALVARFLWIPHMDGTLGIPHRSIQALFFAPAEGVKAAKLRIIHYVDTKVVEGAEAETLWRQLSAK